MKPALRTLPDSKARVCLHKSPGLQSTGNLTLPASVKLSQISQSGGGEGGLNCHAGQTRAPRRGGPGAREAQAHPRGPRARGVGAAPHRTERRARGPPGAAAWSPATGRGTAGAAGADGPPGDSAARDSSQRLRAGFTAALLPKAGGCGDRGVGSPGAPRAPENPCPVLAIKSTSDEIKRAREGVDRRVGEEPTCR